MVNQIISISLLIVGFLFTLFVPGFCIIESYFSTIPTRIKVPLYFILSVIVSSYLVYLVSLLISFSRYSILVSFSFFIPWMILTFTKVPRIFFTFIRFHKEALILAIMIFFLFFVCLYPAIFSWHNGYVVMSSVNWQDTAMHMGIIESLAQGNFPPQPPYYAGVPLTYYYFSDFHSAILVTLYGHFFPRVLVYDNPFFILIFFLSIYALAYETTKKKTASLFCALTGSLFSNFIFTKFVGDLIANKSRLPFFENVLQLLKNKNYVMEYEKVFQMSNMADYFLQNRPMMVGLSAAVMVLVLLIYAFRKKDLKIVFLAGLMAGLLIKFQFFSVLVSLIIFVITLIFYSQKLGFRRFVRSAVIFLLPPIFAYVLFSNPQINNQSLLNIVKENFSFGSWDRNRSLFWHLKFILLNFGLPFVFILAAFLWVVVEYIKRRKQETAFVLILVLSLVFFVIPYTIRFTIYKGDMFKFFYFAVVLASITTFWFISRVIKKQFLYFVTAVIVVVTTTFSSLLTLADSFLNKNQAYTETDWRAGMWIRDNTPKGSVFIGTPTVHSAISEIGGRLRVLAYINWPYSHGYNSGKDNVFSRLDNIRLLYTSNDKVVTRQILDRYKVGYVYYSTDERGEYPEAENYFKSYSFLKKVYSSGDITIYEVI